MSDRRQSEPPGSRSRQTLVVAARQTLASSATPPGRSEPPRRSEVDRNSGTLLALLGLMAAAAGLLFLTALVMPAVFGILVVVCGFVFFAAFHYLVWGWWMPKSRADDDDDSD